MVSLNLGNRTCDLDSDLCLSGLYLHAGMAHDLVFIAHLICCCIQSHAQIPEFVPSESHILLVLLLTLTSTLKQACPVPLMLTPLSTTTTTTTTTTQQQQQQ